MSIMDVRQAETRDISQLTRLSKQLGYIIDEDATSKNIKRLQGSNDSVIWVATDAEIIIGWMQVSYLVRLESGEFCEIVGLVVDEQYRGKGIGKLLIAKAAEWCWQKGCSKLKVRTNVTRKNTHHFYEAMGFTEAKEQKIYEMNVLK